MTHQATYAPFTPNNSEQRRVKEEVIRYVNFCHRGRTVDIGNDIQVTVLYKKATANYVPAAAVRRRWRALFGITRRKASVGGRLSPTLNLQAQLGAVVGYWAPRMG